MKYNLTSRFILLLAVTSLVACRQNGDHVASPEGPACEAGSSRLYTQTTKNASGVVTNTITYDTNGLTGQQIAIGPDTVLEITADQTKNYYVFSKAGDQLLTHRISRDSGVADFYYSYDNEHRLVKRWSRIYTEGKSFLQDSIGMRWEDGNMVEETNLITGGSIATYQYYFGGRGRNPLNKPEQAARWLYRPGSTVVLSKDYVNLLGVAPQFDSKGRLMIQEKGDGSRIEFAYKCK